LILPEIWDEQKGLLMDWDEAQKHLFQSRPDLETKFREVGWTIWRAVCQPESRVEKPGVHEAIAEKVQDAFDLDRGFHAVGLE
jgi:hypothetical protein